MKTCRILLADDHRLFRLGIRKILTERDDLGIVGEASDGLELLRLVGSLKPDLVILDISMPNLRGIETTGEIKALYPELKVLILTMHKDIDYLQSAINAGADGYLLKEDADDALFSAIDVIRSGNSFISSSLATEFSGSLVRVIRGDHATPEKKLTLRERSVLSLIAESKTSKEIGELLFISTRTVEHHRASIMRKLSLKNLADVMKFAIKNGFLSD